VLHLPTPLASLRHSLHTLIEGVVVPFAVFYVFLVVVGFRGALLAGVAWSYAAIGRRLIRRQRVAATLIMGSALLSIRTAVAFATGSAFIYFVGPTASTCLVGLAFLVSAFAGRPIVERLARDFCPFDPEFLREPIVRRFFTQISVLWAVVMLANAGIVMWFLLHSSLGAFVFERTAVSWVMTLAAIGASTLLFLRTMRRGGIAVRWGAVAPMGNV
jgi:hypothetical protein